MSEHPKDPKTGRFVCSAANPMPKGAEGLWLHPSATITGGCAEGCCDDYTCPDCGTRWRRECPA